MGFLGGLTADTGRKRWLKSVANLFGHSYRRVRHADGRRLHIELRDVGPDRFDQYAAALEDAFDRLAGVEWVRINGHLARGVVSFRSARVSGEQIEAVVDGIEHDLGLYDAPFSGRRPEHPADIEPVVRKVVAISADLVAAVLGAGIEMAGADLPGMAFDVAALLNVVDNTPRFREAMAALAGHDAADVGFGALNAFVQAIGSGPEGPLIDLVYQGVKLRGEHARKRVWDHREPRLCSQRWDRRRTPIDPDDRPVELPDGPLEAYANEAFLASLGGFVVGLADTHSLKAATPPLFGGLPKAARYGRDGFIAELVGVLAGRGMITLAPKALRVADRIDTVVVDVDMLVTGAWEVSVVHVADDADVDQTRRRAHRLFDGEAVGVVQRDGQWALGELTAEHVELADLDAHRAEKLGSTGGPLLALTHRGQLRGFVETRPEIEPGAGPLFDSAARADLQVVIACEDRAVGETFGVGRVADAGDGLVEVIRDQQRDGAVVAVVAAGPSAAMAVADLSVGLSVDHDGPPWAADVLCGRHLDDAGLVLEACGEARRVAEQSVGLAGLGAVVAAFLSLEGLDDAEPGDVMLAVNVVSILALANGVRRAELLGERARPPHRAPTSWHRLTAGQVVDAFDTDPDGLDSRQARRRRPAKTEKASTLRRIGRAVFTELANPFTPVLAAAAGVSAVVGSPGDAAMVAAAMGLNGLIGGVERFKAERAVEGLEQREADDVQVIREGRRRAAPVDDIVVGDIIELRSGQVVPADCRLIEADRLQVDQSNLTGESLPVAKQVRPSYAVAVADRSSMVYADTSIASGRARAVVVAVGGDTESRRAATAVQSTTPNTGVAQRLESLTELTMPVAGVSGLFLVAAGLARGQDVQRLVDVGVGMAVAAVPEGLPLLATVAQLAASRRLSASDVLVRNRRAVEALGRVDVVCADKTGTLTEGRIELSVVGRGGCCAAIEPPLSPWQARVLAGGLRASPTAPASGRLAHPTDRAVVDGAHAAGVDPADGVGQWEQIDAMPFEPARGFHAVIGRTDAGPLIDMKGAPEVVIPRCRRQLTVDGPRELDDQGRGELIEQAESLAARGLRVLAVAERSVADTSQFDQDGLEKLDFCGFIGLSDPVRSASADAVADLGGAGVEVLMITGDHPRTARRIAQELSLLDGGTILTGPKIEQLTDEQLDVALAETTVVARATPAHKVRIVEALQRDGRVVAMTGDGANDAAAIRLADVGIALGEDATTAAREAADILVVDERIDTIVHAIAEGRAMWGAVRDAVSILMGGNFGEIGFTVLASLLSESPLNARQLLLINLLTDIAPSLSIVLRQPSSQELREVLVGGPEQDLGRELDLKMLDRALTTGGGAFVAWITTRLLLGGPGKASTVGLLAAVGTQLGQTLAVGAPTKQTTLASVASAAVLVGIAETPGISPIFGCRPVGPIGLATALGSGALATGASVAAPPIWRRSRELATAVRQKLRALGNSPSADGFKAPAAPTDIESAAESGEASPKSMAAE